MIKRKLKKLKKLLEQFKKHYFYTEEIAIALFEINSFITKQLKDEVEDHD